MSVSIGVNRRRLVRGVSLIHFREVVVLEDLSRRPDATSSQLFDFYLEIMVMESVIRRYDQDVEIRQR